MLGGMLAGHDQNGGELTIKPNGTKCKLFYGMSSLTAMKKHAGGKAEYRYVVIIIFMFYGHNIINLNVLIILELLKVKLLKYHTEVM